MASSSDSIFGVTCSIITIPIGATVSVLVLPGPAVRASIIKYASGGSLSIFGNPQGAVQGTTAVGTSYGSLGITALVTGFSGAYLLGTSEVVTLGGPAQFYLSATGATSFAYLMQPMGSFFSSFNTPG